MSTLVNALYTTEHELNLLKAVIKRAYISAAFVFGEIEDSDLIKLRQQGLILEEIPLESSLAWLDPSTISGDIDTVLTAATPTSLLRSLPSTSADSFVVQLQGPLQKEWKEQLQALGVSIDRYVANCSFKLSLTAQQYTQVRALPFVARIQQFSPPMTLRRLPLAEASASVQENQLNPPAPKVYDIKCHHPSNLTEVDQLLALDPRCKQRMLGRNRLRIWVTPEADQLLPFISDLASRPEVSVIEQYKSPQLQVSVARQIVGLTSTSLNPVGMRDGTGEVLGVADTGVDTTHPCLRGQVSEPVILRAGLSATDDPSGHGTHVCAILAGRCTDMGGRGADFWGIAPGAKLVVQSLADEHNNFTGVPVSLSELFQQAYDQGVRIHNNSWGVAEEGKYTIDSFEIDEFVYQHPDFLIVTAAGNYGTQYVPTNQRDAGRGWRQYSTLSSLAAAKNALTIGASCSSRADGPFSGQLWSQYSADPMAAAPYPYPPADQDPICGDADVLAYFSSCGPTDDNRIKPDVVAPGTAILSAKSHRAHPAYAAGDLYSYDSGTSMAAPIATGLAAIIRQYYIKECGQLAPSAALLKATLINGSKWMGSHASSQDPLLGPPNFYQGFGRIHYPTTLPTPEVPWLNLAFVDIDRNSPYALYKDSQVHATWRRLVQVLGSEPLSITLTWTDRPAHGLQQNLNLILIDPNGIKLLGNTNISRAGVPPRQFDSVNNVERICLDAPVPGTYIVQVIAYTTPFEKQGFSLVATGNISADFQ
jgi:serine protease AprX